jgi:hypothetical protein
MGQRSHLEDNIVLLPKKFPLFIEADISLPFPKELAISTESNETSPHRSALFYKII